MELKKPAVIFIGLIFILAVIPGGGVGYASAANQGIVILVTDNEADEALAYSVASLLGARVIVSPWGTYSPEVSAEILSEEPERVIIIGGPVAIPEDYTGDLDDFGIPYERWYGETRYETNLAVIEGLSEEFPEAFADIETVVIANGRDGLALREYTRTIKIGPSGTHGRLIILTDDGKTNETLEALAKFSGLKGVVYMTTSDGGEPLFPLNRGKVLGFARERFGNDIGTEEKATSPGPRDTLEVLTAVQNKTDRAEKLLDGLQIPAARRKLEAARGLLEEAWSAYNAGDYSRAYLLAVRAGGEADFVIARTYVEIRTVYQGSAELRLQRRLSQLEAMVNVLRAKGYDVDEIESLLQQAEDALKRGDYSEVIHDLIPRIKEMLAEKTVWRRGVPHLPHPGGRDRGRP
ncbi:hypothetical protein GQS_10130 [Thermococcus sp. 4557]|uniref:hypothetical protein n=1 Tax=Thermococcus sp. (strain CGMCC 1.5172 / 4557) TaxID=1042877 RepID=UPI000219EA75|nr:hypothetical protein [Thermococcus sp. 4557]AEK73919.1 hypothetical protein GQS_10130 [Thermococcus sp. 4557]